jgi:hypothetical protein
VKGQPLSIHSSTRYDSEDAARFVDRLLERARPWAGRLPAKETSGCFATTSSTTADRIETG